MKSFIAVCDILGFSEFIKRNDLDPGQIVDKTLGLVRKMAKLALSDEEEVKNTPSLTEIQKHPGVGIACFSDTFLLYTKSDTDENCRLLCDALAALVFFGLHTRYAKIRCGVSYGEVEIDVSNSVYVGLPIVQAYELEKYQQWVGGAYSLEAENRINFPSGLALSKRFGDWKVVRYPVPFKTGSDIVSNVAVDWTISLHQRRNLCWSKKSFEPQPSDWNKTPDLCEKWKNTFNFHESVCTRCRTG